MNADGATTVQAVPSTASAAVVGAAAVDVTMTPTAGHSPLLTTSPGRLRMSLGGVGSNIARAIRACGVDDILLLAPVARDGFAAVVKQGLQDSLLRTDGIVEEAGAKSTATVGYLLDGQGEMVGGVADFSIMDHADIKQVLRSREIYEHGFVLIGVDRYWRGWGRQIPNSSASTATFQSKAWPLSYSIVQNAQSRRSSSRRRM